MRRHTIAGHLHDIKSDGSGIGHITIDYEIIIAISTANGVIQIGITEGTIKVPPYSIAYCYLSAEFKLVIVQLDYL